MQIRKLEAMIGIKNGPRCRGKYHRKTSTLDARPAVQIDLCGLKCQEPGCWTASVSSVKGRPRWSVPLQCNPMAVIWISFLKPVQVCIQTWNYRGSPGTLYNLGERVDGRRDNQNPNYVIPVISVFISRYFSFQLFTSSSFIFRNSCLVV
jgi:hypothetical protein